MTPKSTGVSIGEDGVAWSAVVLVGCGLMGCGEAELAGGEAQPPRHPRFSSLLDCSEWAEAFHDAAISSSHPTIHPAHPTSQTTPQPTSAFLLGKHIECRPFAALLPVDIA